MMQDHSIQHVERERELLSTNIINFCFSWTCLETISSAGLRISMPLTRKPTTLWNRCVRAIFRNGKVRTHLEGGVGWSRGGISSVCDCWQNKSNFPATCSKVAVDFGKHRISYTPDGHSGGWIAQTGSVRRFSSSSKTTHTGTSRIMRECGCTACVFWNVYRHDDILRHLFPMQSTFSFLYIY